MSLHRTGIAVVELRARRLARLAVEQLVVRSVIGYHRTFPILSLYRTGIAVVELRARRLACLAVEQLLVRYMIGYHSVGG